MFVYILDIHLLQGVFISVQLSTFPPVSWESSSIPHVFHAMARQLHVGAPSNKDPAPQDVYEVSLVLVRQSLEYVHPIP